jgi:hypothetical protein
VLRSQHNGSPRPYAYFNYQCDSNVRDIKLYLHVYAKIALSIVQNRDCLVMPPFSNVYTCQHI